MSFLGDFAGRMRGRRPSTSVPVFDGVLKPNNLIETAQEHARFEAPADLVAGDGRLWLADGARVVEIDPGSDGAPRELLRATGPITALARIAGGLAIAIAGRRVEIHGGALDGQSWEAAEGAPFVAINALVPDGETLIATEGSAQNGPEAWQRDLMERRRAGRVLRLGSSGAKVLAAGLEYAFGAAVAGDGIWVSESWRHRLTRIGGAGGSPLYDLPGYPSRLAPASGGGHWLSVFATRTQLVEFVLGERRFRDEMMRSMPPELWVAPQIRPPASFLEPLQGGAIKQMGVLKPWAPPRSYGLAIRLDAEGRAQYALHSRVDGRHHGISAVAEAAGALWLLSLGSGALLRLDLDGLQERARA